MRPIRIVCCLILLMVTGCFRPQVSPITLDRDWGERKTYDYHGVKINYCESGQGQPILLLHGFGASSYSWRFLGPSLAENHRVIMIDLKGYGLSDRPRDQKYSVSDQADIVADFIRQQDLQEMVLIGHSMGGMVALMTYFKMGEERGGRIKSLVLVDSAGYPQKMPCFLRLSRIPVVNAIGARMLSPRFLSALVLRKCFYHRDKITEEMIDTYAYYASLPGSREAILQTAKQIVPENIETLTERYKTIRVPVLIIWGKEDKVVPLKVGRKFKRDIPDSELVIIPKCGHIPQEEEPQETKRIINAFLNK